MRQSWDSIPGLSDSKAHDMGTDFRLSHLSLNCHMAQASSAKDTPSLLSHTLLCSRTWWRQARAAWRAAAKTHSGILERGTRYASERKNSWWTVGEWIFLCKGCLERGGKEWKKLFIKEPQLIRSLLAFWISIFKSIALGLKRNRKVPKESSSPASKAWKRLGNQPKPECVEDFNYSARSAKMLWIPLDSFLSWLFILWHVWYVGLRAKGWQRRKKKEMEKRAPCLVYLKHCSPSNPLPTILHPCLSFNVLICKMGIIVFIEVRMGKMPCKP